MIIIIRKLPIIEGEVLLIDANGEEHPVDDDFREYQLIQGGCELIFKNYKKVFVPGGPQDEFKDGGQYILAQLNGNDLSIIYENQPDINGTNPQWIAVS